MFMDNLKIFDHTVADDVIKQEYEQGNLSDKIYGGQSFLNFVRRNFVGYHSISKMFLVWIFLGLSFSLSFFSFKR